MFLSKNSLSIKGGDILSIILKNVSVKARIVMEDEKEM